MNRDTVPTPTPAENSKTKETKAVKETQETKKIEDVSGKISLGLHQSGSVAGLKITALEINDSRCPPDVQCIWAGEARISIRVSTQNKNATSSIVVGKDVVSLLGYEIQATEISPKLPTRGGSSGDTRIIFAVSRKI